MKTVDFSLKVFFLHQFLLMTFLETTRGDFLLTSIPVSTSGDAFRHTTTVSVHQIMFGDFHMINWISNVMLIHSNSASFDPTFERKCESIFLINASFDCLSLVLVLQHQPHLMSCPVHCNPKDATHRRTVFIWLKVKQAYIFFFYWAPFLRTDHATSVKLTVWLICQDNGDDYRNMSAFSDPSCSAASSRGSS